MAIYLNVWSGLLDKMVLTFCDLPFADSIPKTYMAGGVMGLGIFALFILLDFDISVICVLCTSIKP